ncbi:hypothetical protein QFZ64_003616 [Streptomyces sp. B3I8]|nr:hypothetical protein [Streptomyces sp. B3I8]
MQVLPESVRRFAAWCLVALLVAGVGWVVVRLCAVFRPAVVPVLLALLGAALLAPLHRRLVGAGLHRSLSALVTCIAVVAVVGGALYVVVSSLIDNGAQIIDSVRKAALDVAGRLGSSGTSLNSLADEARKLLGRFSGSAVSSVVTGVGYVSETVATALLALLLVFFFLRDADRAVRGLRALAPYDSADTVEAVARRAFGAVEGFMRGTTFIALIDAALITAGLLGLRVPGAVGLGALVFVGAYIPYLGAFLSGRGGRTRGLRRPGVRGGGVGARGDRRRAAHRGACAAAGDPEPYGADASGGGAGRPRRRGVGGRHPRPAPGGSADGGGVRGGARGTGERKGGGGTGHRSGVGSTGHRSGVRRHGPGTERRGRPDR